MIKILKTTMIIVLVAVFALSGCNKSGTVVIEGDVSYLMKVEEETETTLQYQEEESEPELVVEETTTAVTTTVTTTTTVVKEQQKQNPLQACRGRLNKAEQEAYDKFLQKIFNYEEYLVDFTKELNYESFYRVMDALRGDYPEFWLYLSTDESLYDEEYQNNSRFIKISYDYNWLITGNFDPAYMEEYMSQMDSVCDKIISRMPDGTYAEQYEFLGREICQMTTYVDRSDEDWSNIPREDVTWDWCYMNGPLLKGEGLCQAYAYAYQYLCHRAGLWCVTIVSDYHCWNVVQLEDGSTYHVDLTWSDSEGDFAQYFLLTQEEIEADHEPLEGEWVATGT